MVHTRTRLAGGRGSAHHLPFSRMAAATPTLGFEKAGVLGEVEPVRDEMKAKMKRILLDHLPTPEACMVLELHPRITLDKKNEITTI